MVDIVRGGIEQAKKVGRDVVILDTAGRLTIDEALMAEIRDVAAATKPVETLLVVDAMTGQQAVEVAQAFAEAVPLTGLVLTKIDGDARGGAALSIGAVTGLPVKFLGTGEKTDALEPFHPDGWPVASSAWAMCSRSWSARRNVRREAGGQARGEGPQGVVHSGGHARVDAAGPEDGPDGPGPVDDSPAWVDWRRKPRTRSIAARCDGPRRSSAR